MLDELVLVLSVMLVAAMTACYAVVAYRVLDQRQPLRIALSHEHPPPRPSDAANLQALLNLRVLSPEVKSALYSLKNALVSFPPLQPLAVPPAQLPVPSPAVAVPRLAGE